MTFKIPSGIKGFRAEPVIVTTLVGAVLVLLVEFGVPVTDGQQTAIQGVLAAALALFARSQVTSESTLRKADVTAEIVTAVAERQGASLIPVQQSAFGGGVVPLVTHKPLK